VHTGIEDCPHKERHRTSQRAGEEWRGWKSRKQHDLAKNIIKRVVVGKAAVWIEIDQTKLLAALLSENSESLSPLSGTQTRNPEVVLGDSRLSAEADKSA